MSSDKDLMQLIRPGVIMMDPLKQKPIGPAEVMEKFGVTPDKVIEVQSLIGDSTDNVPGVPGIGPKGAAQLIAEFGDLEVGAGRRAVDEALETPRRADRARRQGTDFPRTGDLARRCADAAAVGCAGGEGAGRGASGRLAGRARFQSTITRLGLGAAAQVAEAPKPVRCTAASRLGRGFRQLRVRHHRGGPAHLG